jgi:hypothetical protein
VTECGDLCWTTNSTEAVCDLAVGHEGPHVDTFEGWEWSR